MTRALDAALLARASRVFPAAALADELDVARALADDADDALADDAFAAAHALYDRALKTLAFVGVRAYLPSAAVSVI